MLKSQFVSLVREVFKDFYSSQGKTPVDWEKRDWELYDESVTDTKIICDNCGWSWDKVDGGHDLYICHKCGHNNTPHALENSGGADTAWEDDKGNKVTLQDILDMTKNIPIKDYPTEKLAKIVLNWDDNPEEVERIKQVEISKQYPILIMIDASGKIQWILDGNHRAQKALRSKAKTIPAKLIKPSNLDDKAKRILLGTTDENFKDGKAKGKSKPGRVKKSGASCKGSVSDLRAKAKNASGEKAKMYHWCANMKGGKK